MSLRAATKTIVLCGPSGVGKSTLLARLFKTHPTLFGFSISHTTRTPRVGEVNGIAYHFVAREEFQKLISEGGFVEWAEFSGNYYGTSRKAVEAVSGGEDGKTCILDIDTQGVKLIKANHPTLAPLYIFISPPSVSSLHSRLTLRNTESEESLKARLNAAVGEIEYAKTGAFDVVVVNDDLEKCWNTLEGVVVRGEGGDLLPQF